MTGIRAIRQTKVCVVREEFVALTGGLHEALVLNQCLYWSRRTSDFDLFIQEESRRTPDLPLSPKHGWFYKTLEDLNKECMLSVSKTTVSRIVKELLDNGWLEKRKREASTLDQSTEYRVNLLKLQADLNTLQYTLPGYTLPSMFQNETSMSTGETCTFQNETPMFQNETPMFQNETPYKGYRDYPLDYSEITLSSGPSQQPVTTPKAAQQNERELICSQMLSTFEENVLGHPLETTLDYRNALWKVYQEQLGSDLSLWQDVCQKIASSSFLMGESKNTNFKPTLSWFLKGDNVRKILAGEWVMGDRVVKTTNNPHQDLKDILHHIDASLEPAVIKDLKRFVIEQYSLAVFKSWFAAVTGTVQDTQVMLVCPTSFSKDRIASDYGQALQTFLHWHGYTLSLAVHQPTTQGCH
jgi:hypothetical protein